MCMIWSSYIHMYRYTKRQQSSTHRARWARRARRRWSARARWCRGGATGRSSPSSAPPARTWTPCLHKNSTVWKKTYTMIIILQLPFLLMTSSLIYLIIMLTIIVLKYIFARTTRLSHSSVIYYKVLVLCCSFGIYWSFSRVRGSERKRATDRTGSWACWGRRGSWRTARPPPSCRRPAPTAARSAPGCRTPGNITTFLKRCLKTDYLSFSFFKERIFKNAATLFMNINLILLALKTLD